MSEKLEDQARIHFTRDRIDQWEVIHRDIGPRPLIEVKRALSSLG